MINPIGPNVVYEPINYFKKRKKMRMKIIIHFKFYLTKPSLTAVL